MRSSSKQQVLIAIVSQQRGKYKRAPAAARFPPRAFVQKKRTAQAI
jgi:hypothetical protein